jgi:ribosome recycling factor
MKIDFGKLTMEETQAIAIEAFDNLTTDQIFEVIKAAKVQVTDLQEWIAQLEGDQ